MFIRNCWYVAGWDQELAPGALLSIKIIDDPILVYRTDDGDLVAMEDRCCHRLAPLSLGRLEDGCNIRCMYHGLKFDPFGRCVEIPGQDTIPSTARVRTYPVVGKHSWIWVWMGDPSLADEALIPPAVGYDDPRYILRHGNIDYAANYQLINDNLTDFSHLSYVHANSFGSTELWARIRPLIKVIDRGIRVTRWVGPEDQALKPDAPATKRVPDITGPTALFSTYDYLVPGVLLMYSAIYRAQDMPEDRVSWPDAEPIAANFTSQALTPMSETETRYFFSWGPRSVEGTPEMADGMFKVAQMAFAEDKDMIEAQQRIINLKPGNEVLTTADVGPVQMRAVIRKMIKAENGDMAGAPDATPAVLDAVS
ncbi:MAG: aromatic ring-hydroxylating dioxygenase subunit alpha [Novosphingobium sp.]|nr:aromatic ring-hydroxylating dioxygenase subunit alpha [Novosphingobium sp.]